MYPSSTLGTLVVATDLRALYGALYIDTTQRRTAAQRAPLSRGRHAKRAALGLSKHPNAMPSLPESDRSEAWSGRSSNGGFEAWIAQPDGGFALKESNTRKRDEPRKVMSMAEVKAAGRARAKAAKMAREAEEALQEQASALWAASFDFIFDAASDPLAAAADSIGAEGRTLLVLVPGFASWASITAPHVERWKEAQLLDECVPSGAREACSLIFKWPSGNVKWASEDANVEAAAAWQEAHEATVAAARTLTLLLKRLQCAGSQIVLAAHSLGARVALQALANDLAAPCIPALFLLGAGAALCLRTPFNAPPNAPFNAPPNAPPHAPLNEPPKCATRRMRSLTATHCHSLPFTAKRSFASTLCTRSRGQPLPDGPQRMCGRAAKWGAHGRSGGAGAAAALRHPARVPI